MAHRDFPPYQAVDFLLRNVLRHLPVTERLEHLATWWGFRYQAAPRVVRLRDGSKIRIEPRDYLRVLLYYMGTWEPYCLRLLSKYLRPGSTLLDVGANIGVFSLTGSRIVGPQGRVISVEAVPPTAAALRDNIALNHYDWATVVEAAAWSSEGVINLGVPEDCEGTENSFRHTVSATGAFQARTRRLDDMLADLGVGRVDMIKMDIEGAECEALRGASEILAKHKPTIMIEVNEPTLTRLGASSSELIGILSASGYRGHVINPKGITPLGVVGPNDCLECLFLPEGSGAP